VAVVNAGGAARSNLSSVIAQFVAAAGAFAMLSAIVYAIHLNIAAPSYGINSDAALAQSLTQLAGTAFIAGLLALAAVMIAFLAARDASSRSSRTSDELAWLLLLLGCLVTASGLGGLAGSVLGATFPNSSAWAVLPQLAFGTGATLLGIAVSIGAASEVRLSWVTGWAHRQSRVAYAADIVEPAPWSAERVPASSPAGVDG